MTLFRGPDTLVTRLEGSDRREPESSVLSWTGLTGFEVRSHRILKDEGPEESNSEKKNLVRGSDTGDRSLERGLLVLHI